MAKIERGLRSFANKVVVITGAGSGIGQEAAVQLARQGARLALNDFNAEGLAETARLTGLPESDLLTQAFDVSSFEAMQAFATSVLAHFGQVDMVWCNAGVALGGASVEKLSVDDLRWIMEINYWGVVYGTKAFLPYLRQRPTGTTLVATGSSQSIVAFGYMSGYTSSKFAIRGFYESLAYELRDTNVLVQTIFPGGVRTNIANAARGGDEVSAKKFNRQLTGDPVKVVASFLNQISHKRLRIFGGARSRFYDVAARLSPYYIMHYAQRLFAKDLVPEED